MPTGYTEIIERPEGCTFREYALRCARGMGVCVMQRDQSLDAPPVAREPEPYYEDKLREASGKLRELLSMTVEQATPFWQADVDRCAKYNAEAEISERALAAKYTAIRAEVVAWAPPTKEHEGVKRFMLEQIDLCYRPERESEPYRAHAAKDAATWLRDAIAKGAQDVEYYTTKGSEERARVEESRAWLAAYVASLPGGG